MSEQGPPASTRQSLPQLVASQQGAQAAVSPFSRYLAAGILAINLVVVAAALYFLDESRRSEEHKFRIESSTIVHLVIRDIESEYERVDLSLRMIADEASIHGERDGEHFAAREQRARMWLPELNFLHTADAQGNVIFRPVAGGRIQSIQSNVADREYFIRLRDDPQAGLQITPPLAGRTAGQTVINLARRLADSDGSFGGVAVASISIAHFAGMLARLDLGAGTRVGVFDPRHGWVVRYPAQRDQAGTDQSPLIEPLRQAIATMPDAGFFDTVSEGVERSVAYSRSKSFDFYVALDRPRGLYMAHWQETARAATVVLVVFALLTSAFAMLLYRSRKRQESLKAHLCRSEELFRGVFDNSMIGLATTSIEKGWLTINPALCDILGYQLDELRCLSWADLTHPDDLAADVASFDRVLAGEIDAYELDKRFIRRDGTIVHAYIAARAIRRADRSIDHFIALVQDITPRKRAEAMLRESEADLRAAFEQAAVGIGFVAPDGAWLSVNDRLCDIVGYEESELLGLTFQDITHPDDLANDLAQLERLRAREIDRYSLEKRYLRKDGQVIWVNLAVSLIFNDDGTPNHFVSIVEDIDARKSAERELRRSRELLQRFLDHLPGLAYIKDNALRVVHANRQFRDRLDLEAEQLIGRTNAEVFPGEFGEKISAEDRRVLDSGQTELVDEEFAQGIYQTTKFVIPQDEGPPLLGGITLDVTRRRQLEQRVKAQLEINEIGGTLAEKEFLTHGLEVVERLTNSTMGFLHFVNDDQETIELVTWSAGALKGCTATYDIHYPISQGGIWVDCLRQQRAVTFNDYPHYAGKHGLPEGHSPLCRLISVPVIEEGQARMMIGVGNKAADYDEFDVTTVQLIGNDVWRIVRRLRVEAALTRRLDDVTQLKDKLEHAHLQLLQSEKMASIGQLAAGIAHEINNPISFVTSNLGSLEDYLGDIFAITAAYEGADRGPCADGAQFEAARALYREKDFDFLKTDIVQLMAESKDGLARVAKIVRELKDFARVGETSSDWADLHQGLNATLNIVGNELKYKCTVSKHYGQLPRVWCVISQLNQVFMNLLVNAAHAIADNGEITIRSGRQDEEVFVAIADTGSGIAPENLQRIFDPFFTTKAIGKGTGLGLSLAYGIVQKHRGRIEVHSEVGQGTTFTVWLPINPPLDPSLATVAP